MKERILNQPVAIGVLVRATVMLVTAFGLRLTDEQSLAIYGFVEAFLAVWTWLAVTPNTKVDAICAAKVAAAVPAPLTAAELEQDRIATPVVIDRSNP